jgi:hypothetical protein
VMNSRRFMCADATIMAGQCGRFAAHSRYHGGNGGSLGQT